MKKLFLLVSFLLIPIQVNARTYVDMGEFKITYYCPCEKCSEGYGRKTATQTYAEVGKTIAVDPDIIDLGSNVLIDGEIYTAEDVGGAVEGDHIDIFVSCHDETISKGVQYKNIKVVRK